MLFLRSQGELSVTDGQTRRLRELSCEGMENLAHISELQFSPYEQKE